MYIWLICIKFPSNLLSKKFKTSYLKIGIYSSKEKFEQSGKMKMA